MQGLRPDGEAGQPVGRQSHDAVVLVETIAVGVPHRRGMRNDRGHAGPGDGLHLGACAVVAPDATAPVRDPEDVARPRRRRATGDESFRGGELTWTTGL